MARKQEPYPKNRSKEKFNDMLNLLLITKGKKQHYVMSSLNTSVSLCTIKQNTKKGNNSVCTVCSASVMKSPH